MVDAQLTEIALRRINRKGHIGADCACAHRKIVVVVTAAIGAITESVTHLE